jgi:hypothetical protein
MTRDLPPALLISLDLELHWGVRDHKPAHGRYRANLLGVWEAVPRMLALFEEFEIAATWATVGFLFARSQAELRAFSPRLRPAYRDARLDPYGEEIGEGERDDPLHYAPSLIAAIQRTPRQEVSTHTFSHYYCLEAGQDAAAFRADLAAALAIMATHGVEPRSIVFPRNQHNPEYGEVLREAGIICYRGNQNAWMHQAASNADNSLTRRAARLLDLYADISGPNTTGWDELLEADGLCNLPAGFFLRPYTPSLRHLDGLRLRRIASAMRHAAAHRRIIQIWWHPHNFGTHLEQNLRLLRRLLEVFSDLRERHGMQSLTMSAAATAALEHARPRAVLPLRQPVPMPGT